MSKISELRLHARNRKLPCCVKLNDLTPELLAHNLFIYEDLSSDPSNISTETTYSDRVENAVPYSIPENGFETVSSGSSIINVTAPGHGLTNGTTYRFRGPSALVTGGGGTFQYNNPADFDGITGANIAKAAGYAITTGQYKDGARVTTAYSTANFFHFTVDTDTATNGSIKGGGSGCSVGPVTLSA